VRSITEGSVLTIGLVLVTASEARVVAEPLMAVEPAHAMRMFTMTGEPVGAVATVPLEAFLPVTMPLAFSDKNECVSGIH
jgi:hypothetical protein